MMPEPLTKHQHGKNRVRVLKVNRSTATHTVSEFNVNVQLYGAAAEASYVSDDNSHVVPTDTMKNCVYVVAKRFTGTTPEEFAAAICDFMLKKYSHLSGVDATVSEQRWRRVAIDGVPHRHGFVVDGPMQFTGRACVDRGAPPAVTAGLKDLVVLKTTQSGFAGFHKGQYTTLPDTTERCLSSSVTATWKVAGGGLGSTCAETRAAIAKALQDTLFGPPQAGVFSPSVQATLYKMGQAVLSSVPEVDSITLDMPNIHFIPFPLEKYGEEFRDDIFMATSEPHGTIMATLSRSKLAGEPLMDPAPLRSKL